MNILSCLNDKTVYLAVISYSITLADLDLVVKIMIGLATLTYVAYKALNEKRKYDEK
jgi:hypothetical protein